MMRDLRATFRVVVLLGIAYCYITLAQYNVEDQTTLNKIEPILSKSTTAMFPQLFSTLSSTTNITNSLKTIQTQPFSLLFPLNLDPTHDVQRNTSKEPTENNSVSDTMAKDEAIDASQEHEFQEKKLLESIFLSWHDNKNHEIVLIDSGKTDKEFSCSSESSSVLIDGNTASSDIKVEVGPSVTKPSKDERNSRWDLSLNIFNWGQDDFLPEDDYSAIYPESFVVDLEAVEFEVIAVPNPFLQNINNTENFGSSSSTILDVSYEILYSSLNKKNTRVLRVIYKCKEEGDARIKMKLKLRDFKNATLCVSFAKKCSATWSGLRVTESQTDSLVFDNNQLLPAWNRNESPLPVLDADPPAFHLSLPMEKGNVRLANIKLESSHPEILQPLLHRGRIVETESGMQINAGEDIPLDLVYDCSSINRYDYPVTVNDTISITMSFINEQPLVQPINISWFGECSRKTLQALHVISSTCKKSSLEGTFFRDPMLVLSNDEVTVPFRSDSEFPFSASVHETCTLFTFAVISHDEDFGLTNNGPVLPPLYPRPTVTSDTSIAYVRNDIPEVKRSSTSISIRVPYICLKEGSSPIHLTVTFKGNRSYNFYWTKICASPTTRDQKEMSSVNLILFGLTLLGILEIGICYTLRGRILLRKIRRWVFLRGSSEERQTLRLETVSPT